MAGKSSPVIFDDRVYFVDDRAKLFIYDAKTGEFIARKALGTSMRSTPLVADGKLYICTMEGRWYILKPTDDGVEVVHQLRLPRRSMRRVARRLARPHLLAHVAGAVCLGDASKQPSADPLPPEPQETAAERCERSRAVAGDSLRRAARRPGENSRITCDCSTPVAAS